MFETRKKYKVLCPVTKPDGGVYWMRLGSAYDNKDGSQNMYLDALPVNGKLHVRELDDDDLKPRASLPPPPAMPAKAADDMPF